MANNNWNNYTEKTATPVDADEVMVRDSADGKNKKLLFGTFWKWVAKKLNEATISELQTSNKTIVGALNQLNSESFHEFNGNIDLLSDQYIVASTADSKGSLPTELVGNRYIIIGDTLLTDTGLQYGVQFAFSFGSSKIAIRNCNFNSDNVGKYPDWRYI